MNRSKGTRHRQRGRPAATPSFDAGILAEPRITFGGGHAHVDPKTGLSLYGPYTLGDQKKPIHRSIIVGIVGTPALAADAELFLDHCRGVLTNDGMEPFLRPHFPGFSESSPFGCDFVTGDTWRECIQHRDLDKALVGNDAEQQIRRVIELYVDHIEILAGREPKPNVILCCIPDDVIRACTAKHAVVQRTVTRRHRDSRRAKERTKSGQRFLFDDMNPSLGIEEEGACHVNLRRGLKAEAMAHKIPTQIIWPGSLAVREENATVGRKRVQDIATRAWNFTTGMYHKAGGYPWRLESIPDDTCFVGISFYREVFESNPRVRTCMAQAFTAAGQGYVLRGNSFEWADSEHERSPHLDGQAASAIIQGVLELYKKQNNKKLPGRIVVHKTSRFWDDELAGFEEACQSVPRRDFVAFGHRDIQFFRLGDYPPLRGTFVKFSASELALYTVGYVPFLRTYPGARVPSPLHIVEHIGDSPWNVVLEEILALTKMNWNTADFACAKPITLAFARKVGEILAEMPEDVPPHEEYRFYM
jgi:hypothetical protein